MRKQARERKRWRSLAWRRCNPVNEMILWFSQPCSSSCVSPLNINGHAERCQRGNYWLSCLPFVCINTQLFESLTALCKDESRESRRDWWALWTDRAPLSSRHRSFRQGFLPDPQPSETKAAMLSQTACFSDPSVASTLTRSACCSGFRSETCLH